MVTAQTVYLDEAGGEDEGFTVVCGWISTVARWERFEIDWKLLLASNNLPYFHMKEFSQSTGPFRKWRDAEETRRRFISDAAEIIRETIERGLISSVSHRIFQTADARLLISETLSTPYALAGRACVASEFAPDVEFVFEDGGPDKGGLLSAMNVEYKLPDPIFRPSRDIRDKKGNVRRGIVQLQAADLLAYEVRKHRREFANRTGRAPRRSLYEILKIPIVNMLSFKGNNAMELCKLEKEIAQR